MIEVIPNDSYYFALTAICTIVLNISAFFVSYALQIDKLTDVVGSFSFIMCALISLCLAGDYLPRQIAITVCLIISRLELAGYLLYRVLMRGRDERFDGFRANFFQFMGFWIGQIVWAWGVSLPVIFTNAEPLQPEFGTAADVAGIVVFSVALCIQVLADAQKHRFRADKSNALKVCNVGVWRYSRHPNFFGEIMVWWGIFILASPAFTYERAGYATIVSPVFTFVLLMVGSGMPTAEGDSQRRFMKTQQAKDSFLAYRNQTSPLIPFPTSLYARLPLIVKRIFFFEWPMYETDWSYVGDDVPRIQSPLADSARVPLQVHVK